MKKLLWVIALLFAAGPSFAQPSLTVSVRVTGTGSLFYVYVNVKNTAAVSTGANNATNVSVTCPIPAGATFISANFDGTSDGTNVTWNFPVLGGLNAITPSFSFSIPSGSATIGVDAVIVTANGGISVTAPSVASGAITKTYTAPGPTVVISTNGNDATALSNILPDGSTHQSYPFKTFTKAMDQVKANYKPCQTVLFKPGMYDKANNNINSAVTISTGNSWTTGIFDGLTITGPGATLTGGLATASYFLLISGASIKDVTINKLLFSEYYSDGIPSSVLPISNCDGLVINECTFYKCGSNRPVNIEFTNISPVATTINGCTFSSNPAGTEGANSGALEYEITSTPTFSNWNNINNSLFNCNARLGDGGAVALAPGGNYVTTVLNFSKCAFQGNIQSSTSGNGGAAIYIPPTNPNASSVGSVNIYNTTFLDNIVTSICCTGYGGQISVLGNVLNINGGSITNGGASSGSLRGGGLGVRGTSSSIYPETLINNLTVSGNYATSATNGYGGIYLLNGTLAYAANTTITSNTASPVQTNVAAPGFSITPGTAPTRPSSSRRLYCPQPLPAPLSVKIEKFEAQEQGCSIRLSWDFITDNTFKSVDIQKSADGVNFKTITTLNLLKGNYFDKYKSDEKYYRLKITGSDGFLTYSSVKKIAVGCESDISVHLMGNPVGNSLGLKFYSTTQQPIEYLIEDITGRSFIKKSLTLPSGIITINESIIQLSDGVYYFKFIIPGKPLRAIKFIKQ